MSHDGVEPGCLVLIRNMEVVRSVLRLGPQDDGTLHGILVNREFEDPHDSNLDVWVILVNDRLHRMLRLEIIPHKEALDG